MGNPRCWAPVVPKTSESIDLKFDLDDYVGGMTLRAKNGTNRPSRVGGAKGWNIMFSSLHYCVRTTKSHIKDSSFTAVDTSTTIVTKFIDFRLSKERQFVGIWKWAPSIRNSAILCSSSAELLVSVIGCLHDPANFQQSSSKRLANIQLA